MLNKQQIKILEIVENRFINEKNDYNKSYYDGGSPGGSPANYAKNDNDNPIGEIVNDTIKNEIAYKNFFEYIKNNFNSYGAKKVTIIEAILHAIDDDEEFDAIKEVVTRK